MNCSACLRSLLWLAGAWCLIFAQGLARPSLSFFCEVSGEKLLSYSRDSTLLRDLRRMDASLRIGVLDFSNDRAEALRRFHAAGIPLVAWLLLPEEKGYWFHATNGEAALDRYEAFRRWTEEQELVWEGIGLDLEPALADVRGWHDEPIRTTWRCYQRLLRPKPLSDALAPYQRLLVRIQDDGYLVESYLFPPLLDERAISTESFQRLLGLVDLPVAHEIPMCYTSAPFIEPAMILSYGEEVSAIALGSTGGGPALMGGKPLPTLSWEELSRDLLLAQQICQQVHLYSLEGCLERGFIPRLRDFDWRQPVALYSSELHEVPRTRQRLRWVLQVLDYPILTSVGLLLLLIGVVWGLVWVISWPLRGPRRRRQKASTPSA